MAASNSRDLSDEAQPNRRILVLGSTAHSHRVTAFAWDTVPNSLTVADYDVVILNLVPLQDEEVAQQAVAIPWQQFARLVFSQGSEVIAIGLPGTNFGRHAWAAAWWLPALPACVQETGEEIRNISPEFAYYVRHVRRWGFHTTSVLTTGEAPVNAYMQTARPGSNGVAVRLHPLAETRFQQAIAFELQFRALQGGSDGSMFLLGPSWEGQYSGNIVAESGRCFWLPPPTEITHNEAVDLILRERYGLGIEQPPPAWLESYKLPAQLPIEAEITQHEEEIRRQVEALAVAEQQLKQASRFRLLLYERGEDVLEPAARDALRELGAQVDDPQQRGREDGRLTDPFGRTGMLEIKGHVGQLRLRDVRQLDQWVRDALINEGHQSKGLFIANLFCETPPVERNNLYPDNCLRAAQLSNISLLTTTQIFLALQKHQRGELDVQAFWDAVFNTNGVCPLPELGLTS